MSDTLDKHAIAAAARQADAAFERFRRSAACTAEEARYAMMMAVVELVPTDELEAFKEGVGNLIDAREPARALLERQLTGARTQ